MGGVNCFIGWKRKWKKWIEKQMLPPCMMGCIRYQTLSGLTYQEVKEVGGFVSIEDCVSDKRLNLKLYALGGNENLISATAAEIKLKNFINILFKIGRRRENNVWSNERRKLLMGSSWEKQKPRMMGMTETRGAQAWNRKPFACSSRTASTS